MDMLYLRSDPLLEEELDPRREEPPIKSPKRSSNTSENADEKSAPPPPRVTNPGQSGPTITPGKETIFVQNAAAPALVEAAAMDTATAAVHTLTSSDTDYSYCLLISTFSSHLK